MLSRLARLFGGTALVAAIASSVCVASVPWEDQLPDKMADEDIVPPPEQPVQTTPGTKAMFIWVVFPGDEPTEPYPAQAYADSVSIGTTEYFRNLSRGYVDLEPLVAVNPLRADGFWVADYPAEMYGYDYVYSIARYQSHWTQGFGARPYLGELAAEILHEVHESYLAAGSGNPFVNVGIVYFIYHGDAIRIQNLDPVGGYGYNEVKKSTFPFLDVMSDDFPIDAYGRVPGCQQEDRSVQVTASEFDMRWAIVHETGHFFGLAHLEGKGCTYPDSTYFDYTAWPGNYFCGPYSVMRKTINAGLGPVPYAPHKLSILGWIDEEVVAENTRGMVLEDVRIGRRALRIEIPNTAAIPYQENQYFLLTYHGGNGMDVRTASDGSTVYPSRGLAVWHITPTYPHLSPAAVDLESAWGLFSDPEMVEKGQGYWTVPDTESGLDNLDPFVDLCYGSHSEPDSVIYEYFNQYRGSEGDFFGAMSGANEFSFKTNPNTYGYYNPDWFDDYPFAPRTDPQTVPNTICVRIAEEHSTSIVLDIYVNYAVDLSSPSAEELYYVGQPLEIEWDVAQIDGLAPTCTIQYRADPAGGYEVVATDVSTATGGYSWTPSSQHVSTDAEVRVVFTTSDGQNVYGTLGGSIVVVDGAILYADRSLNDAGVPQFSYDALPYGVVTVDFDGAGPRDLVMSFVGGDAQLYASAELVDDGGIPEYEFDPTAFDLAEIPESILGLAVADLDTDGDEDLCATSQSVPRLYVLNSATGQFEDRADDWNIAGAMNGSAAAAWADYDRDGDVDLLIGTGTFNDDEPDHTMIQRVPDVLLRNDLNAGGGFTDVSVASGIANQHYTASTSVTWGDVNEDGFPDAFVGDIGEFALGGNTEGGLLFVNQGDGTFNEERDERLGSTPYYVNSAIWRDMDNDGDVDLEIGAMFQRRTRRNDGTGVLSEIVVTEQTDVDYAYAGSRVLDSDLDGYEDVLLLPRAVDGKPKLLTRFPDVDTETYYNVATAAGLGAIGKIGTALTADLNGDGDLDILLGRDVPRDEFGVPTGDPSAFLFQAKSSAGADLPQNEWLGVRLSSPDGANNTMGIGAKVALTVDGQPRLRYVDGGSGRGGQEDPTLIFGLGSSTISIDELAIDWPNGHHQVVALSGSERDQVIEVVDSSVLGVIPGSEVGDIEVFPQSTLVDMVFTWETDLLTTPALDRVEFDHTSMDPECVAYMLSIDPSMADVDQVIDHLPEGGQRHTLIWRDRPCDTTCTVVFRGHSAINSETVATDSSWKNAKRLKFCVSQ